MNTNSRKSLFLLAGMAAVAVGLVFVFLYWVDLWVIVRGLSGIALVLIGACMLALSK